MKLSVFVFLLLPFTVIAQEDDDDIPLAPPPEPVYQKVDPLTGKKNWAAKPLPVKPKPPPIVEPSPPPITPRTSIDVRPTRVTATERISVLPPISLSRHITSAFFAAFVGFGTGKLIQRQYLDFGAYLGVETILAIAAVAGRSERITFYSLAGAFLFLRLFEIADTWIYEPSPDYPGIRIGLRF